MSTRRKVPKLGTYFHYTAADYKHLGGILNDGMIRTAESNLSFEVDHFGPDVVWLLDRPFRLGERHGLVTNLTGDLKTHVEIQVALPKAEVRSWVDWAKAHRMDPLDFAALVEAGGGIENALHWRVIERPIPRREWLRITHLPTHQNIPLDTVPVSR